MMGHIVERGSGTSGTGWDASGLWSYARDRQPGVYQVVIEYLDEEGSLRSTGSSGCAKSIVDTGRYPKQELEQDLQDLKDLYRDAALGPSTEAIVKEAEAKVFPDLHRHRFMFNWATA